MHSFPRLPTHAAEALRRAGRGSSVLRRAPCSGIASDVSATSIRRRRITSAGSSVRFRAPMCMATVDVSARAGGAWQDPHETSWRFRRWTMRRSGLCGCPGYAAGKATSERRRRTMTSRGSGRWRRRACTWTAWKVPPTRRPAAKSCRTSSERRRRLGWRSSLVESLWPTHC